MTRDDFRSVSTSIAYLGTVDLRCSKEGPACLGLLGVENTVFCHYLASCSKNLGNVKPNVHLL
jgi:hypothetical protein